MSVYLFIIIAISLILIIRKISSMAAKFDDDNIPGPEGNFMWGNEFELNSPKVHLQWVNWMRKYGLIFKIWSWLNPIVYICDAKVISSIIEQKLPKHFGFYEGFRPLSGLGLFSQLNEFQWKHDRKLISEALRNKDQQANVFEKHLNCVSMFLHTRDAVDFTKLSTLFTLDIIGEILFDYDFKGLENYDSPQNCPMYYHLQNILPELLKTGVSPWRLKFPIFSSTRKMLHHIKQLQLYTTTMIKQRITSYHEDNTKNNNCLLDNLIAELGTTQTMESIRDHIITLAVAGCDPTANSCVFAMDELIKNPTYIAKIKSEIKSEIVNITEKFNAKSLHRDKCPILNAFVTEVLRMHGAGFGTIRTCPITQTFEGIGGQKYAFEKDIPLLLWNYPTHHSHLYYHEPDKFNPERWLSDENENHVHGSYFPFSFGERRCLGEYIALLELKIIIAYFIQNYTFEALNTLEQQTCFTLAPLGPFHIKFTPI